MRYKLLSLITLILAYCASSQAQAQTDTINNPNVVFTGMPRSYEIAGIKVSGADNYEDHIIIGYSGLKIGDRMQVPGEEINDAAKRFWRQGLFSNVQI